MTELSAIRSVWELSHGKYGGSYVLPIAPWRNYLVSFKKVMTHCVIIVAIAAPNYLLKYG